MSQSNQMNRRGFLKMSALGVVSAGAMSSSELYSEKNQNDSQDFPKIKAYRTLGRTGFKTSDIGLGTSRAFAVPVLQAVLDAGVNYIDTAESYGRGTSETNVGKAIKGRDRKKLFITSKLHLDEKSTKEEVIARFRKCLGRLQTDYIDCLLLHGAPNIETLKNKGFHDAVKQLKTEGKLRYIGVSNHGSRLPNATGKEMEKILMAAVQDGRFDLLLIVYNFIQHEAGERIMKAAKEKNIATTIMKANPITLYDRMKERMERLKIDGDDSDERSKRYLTRMEKMANEMDEFSKANNLTNPNEIRDAAIRFVLSNKNVDVLNLAFRTFEDVENFLKLSGHGLTVKDKQALSRFHEGCSSFYCRHACGICESKCPSHVPVNTIMRYNHYFDACYSEKYAMEKYAALDTPKADNCLNCEGFCDQACPYGVPAKALLSLAHRQLTLA